MQDRVTSLFPYRTHYLAAKIQTWGQRDAGISLYMVWEERKTAWREYWEGTT